MPPRSSFDSGDLEVWHRLLPAEVRVSCGSDDTQWALTLGERLSLGAAGAHRVKEFAAGRHQAQRALALLGIEVAELLRSDSGGPLWPIGVVGSIAHTGSGAQLHVAAAVARSSDVAALGIDVESGAHPEPRVWSSLLLVDELERVVALPAGARAAEVSALWCAKEAVAKASGCVADIRRIAVRRCADSDEFSAEVDARALGSVRGEKGHWQGRVVLEKGRTFAAVVRRAHRSAVPTNR